MGIYREGQAPCLVTITSEASQGGRADSDWQNAILAELGKLTDAAYGVDDASDDAPGDPLEQTLWAIRKAFGVLEDALEEHFGPMQCSSARDRSRLTR